MSEKRRLSVEVSKEMHDLIEKVAQHLGISMSDIIRHAVKQELTRRGYMDLPLPPNEAIQQTQKEG